MDNGFFQVMSGVKGKGGPLTKSRSGSKLREQKSVSGLVTVEEEGKENLGPEVVSGSFGGKVEKDGVVEDREVEREEWKGEVRILDTLENTIVVDVTDNFCGEFFLSCGVI